MSKEKFSYLVDNSHLQELTVNYPNFDQSSTSSDSFYVKPDTMSPINVDSLDVDSGSGSEPEGDETMTIASLIDYPKENHDEQQTQMESPTQLDDYDDDEGKFLFEE
jgi:hypothetical protein